MGKRLLDIGFWCLVLGPVMFAWRSVLQLQSLDPGAATIGVTILSGVASLIGLILIGVGSWKTAHRAPAIIAIVVALGGHYIVADFWANGGAALTYLGTGMAGWIRNPRALWVGAFAGVGAILRGIGPVGLWLLIPAALWLAWELSISARDKGMHIPENAVPA